MAGGRRFAAGARAQRGRDRSVRAETRPRGLAGGRSGAPGAGAARACSASHSLITLPCQSRFSLRFPAKNAPFVPACARCVLAAFESIRPLRVVLTSRSVTTSRYHCEIVRKGSWCLEPDPEETSIRSSHAWMLGKSEELQVLLCSFR